LPSRVSQQRRLPNARLAMKHKDGALTLAHLRQQRIELSALADAAEETRLRVGVHLGQP
jgi:hypothetical protein